MFVKDFFSVLVLVVRFKTGNQYYNDNHPITCLDNSFQRFLHFISTIFISSFDRSFQLQLLSFHLLSPRTFCGRILLVWRCPTVERKWILFPLHARSPARAILLLRHFHTVVIFFWDLIWWSRT